MLYLSLKLQKSANNSEIGCMVNVLWMYLYLNTSANE